MKRGERERRGGGGGREGERERQRPINLKARQPRPKLGCSTTGREYAYRPVFCLEIFFFHCYHTSQSGKHSFMTHMIQSLSLSYNQILMYFDTYCFKI